MAAARDMKATPAERTATASEGKAPRTERGRKTLRAILDAAAAEFGENGFHEASISAITRRAGVALGSFYTYFDSKDAVFRALVQDMSGQVRDHVTPRLQDARDALDAERAGLEAFLEFVRAHKEVYRIIDESEFVDNEGYRRHYSTTVQRIRQRIEAAIARGEMRPCDNPLDTEVLAWAIGGMNVFLGIRYGVWDDSRDPADIAAVANDFLARGLRM